MFSKTFPLSGCSSVVDSKLIKYLVTFPEVSLSEDNINTSH